jgi:hypothetical protein
VTLLCKGLTREGELGQCGRNSQVKGRFVASVVVSHIDEL